MATGPLPRGVRRVRAQRHVLHHASQPVRGHRGHDHRGKVSDQLYSA